MPEDSKKHKSKNDPKDQRRPRQQRKQAAAEKNEKKLEEPKAPAKPVYEEPGPEFYKNLKRETDEILKITEDVNAKYKKKEIQSNWSKYEMPIESYEEMEEQENMGADYEKLIAAPLSIGGHFQFKHEKSWDISKGPSLYDKYFDINMENLALAMSTIPFHERNGIDKSIFSQTDILNMENRATRYKQKYYNDKSFITPELVANDKVLNTLKEILTKENEKNNDIQKINTLESIEKNRSVLESNIMLEETKDKLNEANSNQVDDNIILSTDLNIVAVESNKNDFKIIENPEKNRNESQELDITDNKIIEIDDIILASIDNNKKDMHDTKTANATKFEEQKINEKKCNVPDKSDIEPKNPVLESPEDLEKWLDDFLES